jgi:hypothetical protein
MSGAAHAVRVQGPDGTDTAGDLIPVSVSNLGFNLTQVFSSGRNDAANDTGASALAVNAGLMLFDGQLANRFRGNMSPVLLAVGTRNSTTASPDQTNYNGRGVIVFFDETVGGGGAGVVLRIQGKEPGSPNAYYNLNQAPAAITGAGVTAYVLYPGAINAVGDVQQVTGGILPVTWRINAVHTDGNSHTYGVSACVLL